MPDRRHLTWGLGLLLGLTVVAFIWSSALYILIGWSLSAVRPWSVAEYIAAYGIPGAHGDALWISLAVAGGVGSALGFAFFFFRPRHYFGDARWAYRHEVRKAGLYDDAGILLGQHGGTFLRSNEPLHTLVTAPTRSGKGVGIVIPNLLSWPDSVVVLDIKHENHDVTSGFRATHGQRVFKWSPADDDGRSHRFNFFDAVRPDPGHRISDLQRLATILLPDPPGNSDSMWNDEARSLFLGLALYVLDTPGIPHTIGEVYRTLMSDADLAAICEHLVETRADDLDPAAVQCLSNFMYKPVKERGGVKSNLTAALNLWANPVIDAATSASDFDLAELRRKPTSIYVGVTLNQLGLLSRLLNLFFQQCVDVLTRDLPGDDEPLKVLLLIDEFASLGRMDVVAKSLGFIAGYNVRMVNIVQGLGQLDQLFHPSGRESIVQNSALQVYFAANDETTATYVSKRLGTTTIRTMSKSDPGGFSAVTKSTSYTRRDLMLPEEVRLLDDRREIVFKEAARPILARKLRYFSDKAFTKRLMPPAAVPVLDAERIPPRRFDLPKRKRQIHGETVQEGGLEPEDSAEDEAQVTEILALGEELQKLLDEEADDNPEADAAAEDLKAQLLALTE